jgi:hypothetical protein
MSRENNTAVYVLLAIYLYGRLQDLTPAAFARRTVAKAKTAATNAAREAQTALNNASDLLQQGGASVYEATHPTEAKHESDLPGVTLTRQAVLAIAKEAAFPDPKLAAAIALAESGGSTGAVARSSREYSVGLWQINVARHNAYSVADMKDPIKNAHAAFKISKGGTDWRAWSAFNNGRYKQFRTGVLAP